MESKTDETEAEVMLLRTEIFDEVSVDKRLNLNICLLMENFRELRTYLRRQYQKYRERKLDI